MSEPIAEGRSEKGRRVRVTRECGAYAGAAPYYQVSYGRAAVLRYTPFQNIAEHYRERFLADVTDPTELAAGRPTGVTKPPPMWGGTGMGENGLADPHEQRESDMGFVTSGTPLVGPRRGGRPRAMESAPSDAAARMRRYRVRRRSGASR